MSNLTKLYSSKNSNDAVIVRGDIEPTVRMKSANHVVEIEVDGEKVKIPNTSYVRVLEDQIKNLKKTIVDQKHDIDNLRSVLNRTINTLNRHESEINSIQRTLYK